MSEEKPFHLQGNFAPVEHEVTATDLPVEGTIPPELTGLYARNSANPPNGSSVHWFMGQGMVHGVRLENGRAAWYRNRYVQTPHMSNPDVSRQREDGTTDRTVSLANTHVIRHGGKIMALEEGSFPYELSTELETIGPWDFDGKLDSAMTAHPKICPQTGELLFFGYSGVPPYLVYHRADASGRLVQSEEITVGGPTMMHDFAVTRNRTLFMDLPVVFEPVPGGMPFHWDDDYPARIGIMPRDGTDAEVTWFDVEPCYIFHGLNAYDDGNRVVFDACRSSEMWRQAGEMQGDGGGKLTFRRFIFDLSNGSVKEEDLDDRAMEFPRVADAVVGLKHRYGFLLQLGQDESGAPSLAGVLKQDLERGTSEVHDFGPGRIATEPCFVPAAGADPFSDEGYVLTYVFDESKQGSELVILDASNLAKPPVARIELPQRVPFGFHGSWMPDLA